MSIGRGIACATAAVSLVLGGGTAGAGATLGLPQAAGGFAKPVIGAHISQGFGCTWFAFEPVDSACPGGHWHSGVDLAAAAGTPVYATLAGSVEVLEGTTGFGLHIVIDHGNGLTSLYGHLSAVSVATGELVSAAQPIGAVGSTGNSTGPHLHFELRRGGIAEDPRLDLALP